MGGKVKDTELGVPMKRIIMHWTGGADGVNDLEKDAYHFIVSRDGGITPGKDKVEDNIPPLVEGQYAAHTWKLNSYSIGVALDAMAGATERPFSWGHYPLSTKQVDALCLLVATLSTKHGVPVTPETILTHAEVQPTLGVKQKFKWDITVLPGMTEPQGPRVVGDILREKIKGYLQ